MKNSKHILVVDDDRNNLKLIIRALGQHHLPIVTEVTHVGDEAMDYLFRRGKFQARPAGNPDLVMLDLNMAGMDGLEVLQQVRSDPGLKLIPVVMFTSIDDEHDRLRSYELGANAYVVKPVNFEEFQAAIKLIADFWTALNVSPPETRRGGVVLAPCEAAAA